jgi:hypothetical protein
MSVDRDVMELRLLTVAQLRSRHIDVFGERTRSSNKQYLVKRIAWRMQANAWGGLSTRALRRAEDLANEADIRMTPPKHVPFPEVDPAGVTKEASAMFKHDIRVPVVGALIKREYKGREIVVRVRHHGFEWNGEIYRSLSAVAWAVTGSRWNGYQFFRLHRGGSNDE